MSYQNLSIACICSIKDDHLAVDPVKMRSEEGSRRLTAYDTKRMRQRLQNGIDVELAICLTCTLL